MSCINRLGATLKVLSMTRLLQDPRAPQRSSVARVPDELYTRYPIVARALGLAFRPSALVTISSEKYI